MVIERERRGPGAMQIEREMRGPEQVRRRGGERDKYIMWIRMRGGDFFFAGVLFKISSACCRVFKKICFGSGWLHQLI
jgi:hypothetical protein